MASDGVDNKQILTAILDLAEKVSENNAQFREFRGEHTAKVSALEASAKSERFWMKVQMVCVVPTVGVLHQVAAHFGWLK
jgi:hypothetical protein